MMMLLLTSALACVAGIGAQNERLKGKEPLNSCYFVPQQTYEIEDIPGDLCTNILYSFCSLSKDTWEVVPQNPQFDIEEGGYKRFVGLKEKYPHLRTDISVGGGGSDSAAFSEMAADQQKRASFVKSVVQLLTEHGFDGFDVDWETPVSKDKDNHRILLQELKDAFVTEGQGWRLTIAAPTGSAGLINNYDIPALCSILDAVYMMGYDLRGYWNNYADVHSMLYRRPKLDFGNLEHWNVNDGALFWGEFGCPRDKLVIGMPFYGYSYVLKDAENHDLHAPTEGGTTLSYTQICKKMLDEPGWVEDYDDVGLVPFAYRDTDWIGYEDTNSLAIKTAYIRDMGFLGAMNWQLGHDDSLGECHQGTFPLIKTIYNGLQNYTVPVSSSN